MTSLILLLTFAATAVTTLLLLAPAGDSAALRARVAAIRRPSQGRAGSRRPRDEEMALPFSQRVIAPLLESGSRLIGRLAPHRVQEAIQLKLVQAGNPTTVSRFLVGQFAVALLAGLFGSLFTLSAAREKPLFAVLMIAVAVLLGWRFPGFMLSRQITARRQKIDRALPDVLDLLSVSVEAGLGLDGAIQKVGEKFPEPTAGEFRELLKAIRLGTPRAEALRGLADRTGVTDMRTFTAAVVQAEQLGVSISRVLKGQSEALRVKRKQRIEEKAMQLPVKMLFPMVFFIFPTIFIVIFGPIALQVMGTLAR